MECAESGADTGLRTQESFRGKKPLPVRPLTDAELTTVAGLLDGLARRFEIISQALLAREIDRVVVADLRANLAQAGRHLLRLLHHDALAAPVPAPPWLSLSLRRYGRRTFFDGVLDDTTIGPCRTMFSPMGTSRLIRGFIQDFEPFDSANRRRQSEVAPTPFRRRHVFLEAAVGWLGIRLGLHPDVKTRTATVFPARQLNKPDEPLVFCIDLFSGQEPMERLLLLDMARTCTATCNALARETDRIAAAVRQAAVPANVIQLPMVPNGTFYDVAVALLAETRSIIQFRNHSRSHADWPALSARIPRHLMDPVAARAAADRIASLAGHELAQARVGTFYGAWIDDFRRDPASTMRAIEEAADRARLRAAKAAEDESETATERTKAAEALEEAWLDAHKIWFRGQRENYESMFARHRTQIDSVTRGFALKTWSGTSACDVMRQIAADLACLLDIRSLDGDYWHASMLSERLASIEADAWRGLETGVRNEAAQIVHGTPRAGTSPMSSGAGPASPPAISDSPIGIPSRIEGTVAAGPANDTTAPHGRERPAAAVNRIVPTEVDAEQLGLAKARQRANKERKSRPDPKAIDRDASDILKDALQQDTSHLAREQPLRGPHRHPFDFAANESDDLTASANHSVKIRVLQADGKYRGSLFKDGSWHEHRWTGAPKPNLQESMVCKGDPGSGQWFLIEYVLPRKVVGQPENDSLFDESSYCCRRTPAQALHWFQGQAFGPPPALVEQVRRLAKLWSAFRVSPSAQSMLARVAEGNFINSDDPIFTGSGEPDLLLLRDAELISTEYSSGSASYFASELVKDMGIEGFIAWTNKHLDRVSSWLESTTIIASPHPTRMPSDPMARATSAPTMGVDAAHPDAADSDSPPHEAGASAEPEDLQPEQTSDPIDDWKPSVHQGLVLALLKRDGRLRAGKLWERISPKHVGERAHQDAMSDLVTRERVGRAGKGKATEYWLL